MAFFASLACSGQWISALLSQPPGVASAALDEWPRVQNQRAEISDRFESAEGRPPKGIELYPSPGHLHTHHSLKVIADWGRVIVAGDAVMNRESCEAEDGFSNSVDFEAATETIRRIKSDADYILPGHGNFSRLVPDNWRLTASSNLRQSSCRKTLPHRRRRLR